MECSYCLQALLKLICELAKGAGRVDHLNRMMASLYAVLVCEVLISSPKVCPFYSLQMRMISAYH